MEKRKPRTRNKQVFVISTRRPTNIERIENMLWSYDITWIVKDRKDLEDYTGVNPDCAAMTGGSLVDSRNMAIELAFRNKQDCVMIDDDLKSLALARSKDNKDNYPLTFEEALLKMEAAMKEIPFLYLVGTASTNNAFYYNPAKPISTKHFIGGWFTITKYGTDLRYDPNITLKEDYDFTLQHITKYGGVIRCDSVLADFEHYSNKGGVVDSRNTEKEQKNILYLKKKWGGFIQDNPRRPNEILLRIKTI